MMSADSSTGCFGYCRRCDRIHRLDGKAARQYGEELMKQFDSSGHIDFSGHWATPGSSYAARWLFGPARGKMFGVLQCLDGEGREVVLHAFSGQFNGLWQIPGWVDPLFDVPAFHRCQDVREREIKALGARMEQEVRGSAPWQVLKTRRRELSRKLMADIFSLYKVPNFRGDEASLQEVFTGNTGIPTGTGDCCAPKLLACAARNNLVPLSLAEFYYGRDNVSKSCRHKQFYLPCATRCQPILGYMLCGIEEV